MPEQPRGIENKHNAEESKEKLRHVLFNRWTGLLGVLGVVLALKFGLDGKRKVDELREKVDQSLHLDEKDLPSDEKEIQDGLDAIEHLKDVLEAAAQGEHMIQAVGGESEGQRIVSTRVVRQNPMELIVDELDENGEVVSTLRYDLSYPDKETATDENYKAMKDYFKSDCSGWTVERMNQWEYTSRLKSSDGNYLWIRVEEDGSFTVGSLTDLDDERNVNSISEIAVVLGDKEEILKLNDQLRDGEITTQEFKKKLKEMGYLPAGME